ncbi:MAG: PEP-utilizing enzyme, partial [Kofleriaceae bacterium]
STAQTAIVESVESAGVAPYSMRVCAGYLYSAPRTTVTAPSIDRLGDIEARLTALVGDLANLGGRGTDVARSDVARSVDDAISRYVRFYAIWSTELSPLVARARRGSALSGPASSSGAAGATAAATGSASSGVSVAASGASTSSSGTSSTPSIRRFSVEALLLGVARGELDEAEVVARLGVLSPSWDVVVPTYGERPELLRDALARAREIVKLPRQHASGVFRPITDEQADVVLASRARRLASAPASQSDAANTEALDLAMHDVANLGERDDEWFARAQWMVRRALLARGKELGLDEGDVFWLPLEAVVGGITVDDARRRAAAARAAAARATRWEMPLVVGGEDGGVPVARATASESSESTRRQGSIDRVSSGSITIPPSSGGASGGSSAVPRSSADRPSSDSIPPVRRRAPTANELTASSGSITIPPTSPSGSIAIPRTSTPKMPGSSTVGGSITPSTPDATSTAAARRTREPSYGPLAALEAEARGEHVLRGIGSGGRVQGRVVRFASLASSVTVGRGDVVVARAVTPALAVMVIGCAAIVSETGGFLDHGAAMARELGIPCVVGCKDAWTILDDGMLVTVDGDLGLVTTHG